METPGFEMQFRRATEVLCDAEFDQLRTETGSLRRKRRGAAFLSPFDLQRIATAAARRDAPVDGDLAAIGRQGSILQGVGGELMQDKAERQDL